MRNCLRKPACWVFLILLGSNAFFWHTRDWNTASRLMLTYSLVDRGTVVITGLEEQTGDKARFQGEYYSDKLPGFPLLAALPYAVSKLVLRIPSHPLREALARQYWAADYWVTLFTSGLFTACHRALYWSTGRGAWAAGPGALRCSGSPTVWQRRLTSMPRSPTATRLRRSPCSRRSSCSGEKARDDGRQSVFCAGFLAAYAAVIELHVGPVSAIIGLYLLVQCISRQRRLDDLALFGVGAAIPTFILLGYNQLAFGSPWEMGYFHHATRQFAEVHSADHPLGLAFPESFWGRLGSLLWGRHRGLAFYAPIVFLTVPGWLCSVRSALLGAWRR